MEKLFIVQGDTYSTDITIENVDLSIIDKVYFSSSSLGVKKECPYNAETKTYYLLIDSDTTSGFEVGVHNFDITLIFKAGEVFTALYKINIDVLKKVNNYEL